MTGIEKPKFTFEIVERVDNKSVYVSGTEYDTIRDVMVFGDKYIYYWLKNDHSKYRVEVVNL